MQKAFSNTPFENQQNIIINPNSVHREVLSAIALYVAHTLFSTLASNYPPTII